MPSPRQRPRRAPRSRNPLPDSQPANNHPPIPGSYIHDFDFASAPLHRPFRNGEIIDLTDSSSNLNSPPDLSNLLTSTSHLITQTATLAATYGLQKLNEQNLPSHVSDFILASTQRAANVDWLRVSQDVLAWVQTHPQEAKVAGYVVAGGAVFFKPRLLPKLAWEAWKIKSGGLGAREFSYLVRLRVGSADDAVVNPFSGLTAGVGLATSAAAAVIAGIGGGVEDEGEGEDESDFAVLTRTAWKLAMRKVKRAKRRPAGNRRRP
ncbi:hypothetical protein GLAREA_04284 [Glarea lozoyensis ATCC 20868]|uniref:Uncharacterized protein n=1 Tax=Glarea lozoyensis (strain ATCC 20868 / MF5171) TaxID=1116229 RepID=S3DLT1_GLAL2|nr:uncharacterized protein GLAREA_04284 [Glarea lozoyensis ATCC 20868]EPE27493.1 hypothetical protein GLAREA_04284 [Glarea lozoyensis ATCC 20868]